MTVTFSVSDQEQWKANPLGQAADQAAGQRQQSPDLLPDGEDAGHLGGVPDYQTLSFPGEKQHVGFTWKFKKIRREAGHWEALGFSGDSGWITDCSSEMHWMELESPFVSVWHSRKRTYGGAEASWERGTPRSVSDAASWAWHISLRRCFAVFKWG